MTTLSGPVGAGVMVPEIVSVWPEDTVAPAAGLENAIEPEDVDVRLVVVGDVVVLLDVEGGAVEELMLDVVEDVVVLLEAGGGTVEELIFASTEKTIRLTPTSNTTEIRTTLLAFDPCGIPVACDLLTKLIVKVSPAFE